MTDLDETRELIERSLCPLELSLLRRNGQLDTWMWSYRMQNVSINDITYGADVEIVPGLLDSFFVAQIPATGSSVIRCGRQEIQSHPGLASVPNPDDWLSMRWTADCAQRVVRFEQPALEAHLADMLGHPLHDGPLRFHLDMDVRHGAGSAFDEEVSLVARRLERSPELYRSEHIIALQEQILMSRLLFAAQHNYSAALNGDPPAAPSRVVRDAIELMRGHATQRHTLTGLARSAGVSMRSLEREFLRHTGTSPMAYYRNVRLDRVRQRLRAADPTTTTVADVAQREGFLNRGRFAADYRRRHGESPATTFRR